MGGEVKRLGLKIIRYCGLNLCVSSMFGTHRAHIVLSDKYAYWKENNIHSNGNLL